jgi:hypothetical protein
MFFRGSRYETVGETTHLTEDGREIRHKRLRIVTPPAAAAATRVRQGDRPDLVAFRALGDAEAFWRLADANRARRPVEMTARPGRLIRVPGGGG